ncbi:MAG TPA: helix-turn-helix domain-containing protein, partial [Gemmatimonadales bacterium]|nr:helix-turn-helix domain-containing protein [Gemmatimonadales bacterium]
MADPLDLTPFGFTPTETRMYATLVSFGPGTGYALAQAAGLARANAYSALEGLVSKGAARVDGGRPKRYRPESGAALLSQLSDRQAAALER